MISATIYGRCFRLAVFLAAFWLGYPVAAWASGELVPLGNFDLPPGGTVTVSFDVTVDSPLASCLADIVNQGSFSGSNFATLLTDDPSVGGTSDPTITLIDLADLSIATTFAGTSLTAGGAANFTVTVANAGASDATGATVANTFPAALSGISWTCAASAGSTCAAAGPTNINDTVNLLSGGTLTYTVSATVDPAATGMLSNTASVVAPATTTDCVQANNAETANTTLGVDADLSLTLSGPAVPPMPGDNITYTVTVNNAGPSDATGVMVTDTLPAGVTLIGTSGCAEDPTAVPDCSLGNLAAGSMASYTIDVLIDPAATSDLSNTACASSATGDSNTGDNCATVLTTLNLPPPPEADLSLSLSGPVAPPMPGDNLTYTVTVNNAGPTDATGVMVTDTLPAGVTLIGTSGCAEDPTAVPDCSLGNLAAGSMASYTLDVLIDPAATADLSNTACASSATADSNTGDNCATVLTTLNLPPPPEADLSLSLSGPVAPPMPGDNLTYTVTVNNAGPTDATDVMVTDTLPAGVTLIGTSGCAEDPNGVPNCSLGNLAAGSMASYTIDVLIDPAATSDLSNTACASTATADSNTGDNCATALTTLNLPPPPPPASPRVSPAQIPIGGSGSLTLLAALLMLATAIAFSRRRQLATVPNSHRKDGRQV